MIIDGRKLAEEIITELKPKFKRLGKVVLAVVVVGGSDAIFSFIAQKKRVAEKLGIAFNLCKFPANATEADIIKKIKKLAGDNEIKGIIVQLPLPEHISNTNVLNSIPKEKDVDALSDNAGNSPISVEVVKFIFKKYKVNLAGKNIAVVGFGRLIGMPIYNWLGGQVHSDKIFLIRKDTSAEQRREIIGNADILISGVGVANLISSEVVKPKSVLIDFGYDFEDGIVYGDIEKSAAEKASLFTPTPGGTGPILVVMIFKNLFSLIKSQ